ncbi:MAG: hypothetical protein ACWA5K_05360 [bacterium]
MLKDSIWGRFMAALLVGFMAIGLTACGHDDDDDDDLKEGDAIEVEIDQGDLVGVLDADYDVACLRVFPTESHPRAICALRRLCLPVAGKERWMPASLAIPVFSLRRTFRPLSAKRTAFI